MTWEIVVGIMHLSVAQTLNHCLAIRQGSLRTKNRIGGNANG